MLLYAWFFFFNFYGMRKWTLNTMKKKKRFFIFPVYFYRVDLNVLKHTILPTAKQIFFLKRLPYFFNRFLWWLLFFFFLKMLALNSSTLDDYSINNKLPKFRRPRNITGKINVIYIPKTMFRLATFLKISTAETRKENI